MTSITEPLDTNINKLSFLWLVIIGCTYVMFDAYGVSVDIMNKALSGFKDYGDGSFALQAAGLSLREMIPVKVAIMLAYLSPVIGIFELMKMKKMQITDIEKRKILISSRFKNLIVGSPFLVIMGLIVGTFAAYLESNGQWISGYITFWDFISSLLKSVIFGIILAAIGAIQIILFFKWPKIIPVIILCLLVVYINYISVLVVDYFSSVLIFKYFLTG